MEKGKRVEEGRKGAGDKGENSKGRGKLYHRPPTALARLAA